MNAKISDAASATYAAYSAVYEAHAAAKKEDRELLYRLRCELFEAWWSLHVLDVGLEEEVES